jgi:hypothetical protein
MDSPFVTDLITLSHCRGIDLRGSLFYPFVAGTFRTSYAPFMEKYQRRVIV